MGWTNPVNVPAGAKAKASFINTQVLDNLRHLYDPPAAEVYRSTALNLSSGAFAAIPFNAEIRDNAAIHSTGTNPERLTAPISGRYEISARVNFAGSATGVCALRLTVNGSDTHRLARDGLVQATKCLNGTKTLQLAAGDYVTVEAFQSSGATMGLPIEDWTPSAEIRWVGPSD